MNKLLLCAVLILPMFAPGCLTDEAECKKTEAPEINIGLLFYGSIQINEPNGTDITEQFTDAELNMLYYKVYCENNIEHLQR